MTATETRPIANELDALAGAADRLGLACGLELDPGHIRETARRVLRRAESEAAPESGERDPLLLLHELITSCGMQGARVQLPLREAVHHARDDRPMVMARVQSGRVEYLTIQRRGWSEVRVGGLAPVTTVMKVRALAKSLGVGTDANFLWLAVERDLPAQPLSASGGGSNHGGTGEGGHGDGGSHDHHVPPFYRILALARLERRDLWSLLAYAIVTGLLYMVVPSAADALVSNISFGGQQQVYLQALFVLAIVLALFLALHALVRALAFTLIERLQRRIFVRFTADLASRLPRVCQREFDRHHGPELTNRFFDIMTLQKAAAQLLLDGLDVALTFLVGSSLLAFYAWSLFWLDAGLLLAVVLIIWGLGRRGVLTSIEESKAKYATAGWLQQVAMFSTVFKAPGGVEMARARTDELTRWYLRSRQAHFRILFRQVIGLLGLEVVAAVLLLVWGGLLVLNGQLSVGQLVGSQLILAATLRAVSKFWKQLETAYDCLTAVDKVGHLVDLSVESPAGEVARPGSPRGADVRVVDVRFAYRSGRPVLRGVNLRLEPGARVAVVAPSSAGSTTLIDLIYGIREPDSGYIDIDGLDLRHWNRAQLRRQVARVHGDDELFDGTIAENIRLGNEEVGLAEVREALDQVDLLKKVQRMPGGIHEPISLLGHSLSGTERRQVLLARAIVSRPRLLMLDTTLDGFEPEEIDRILAFLSAPERPWTLLVVTRDPDVIRRFDQRITLDAPELDELNHADEHHGH
jgi:ABC-type bacteriocin/lantibiotic exporter with double-glycine peptidase domain